MIFFLLKITACNFAPGSYPYAQEYEINVDESLLIEAVQNFKNANPKYNLPEQIQLKDGRHDKQDHWYHIYFYYPQEDQIVYAWTRPSSKGKTTFALIGIHQGLTPGKWKRINKDFDDSENELQKRKFEERILNKVKAKLHA